MAHCHYINFFSIKLYCGLCFLFKKPPKHISTKKIITLLRSKSLIESSAANHNKCCVSSDGYFKSLCNKQCGPFIFFLFFCCFMSQVSSYGHGGTVSSPNHTFSWAMLNKQLQCGPSKQCGPRSDCSYWSSLICVHTVCLQAEIVLVISIYM